MPAGLGEFSGEIEGPASGRGFSSVDAQRRVRQPTRQQLQAAGAALALPKLSKLTVR